MKDEERNYYYNKLNDTEDMINLFKGEEENNPTK